MSIGPSARKWFLLKYGSTPYKTYTSRYYSPEISWPKTKVWWLQIPIKSIDAAQYEYVNILCQVTPLENKYHYLKVPVKFLNDNFDKFHQSFGKISLYLSANPDTLFIEERGKGRLDFSGFLMR